MERGTVGEGGGGGGSKREREWGRMKIDKQANRGRRRRGKRSRRGQACIHSHTLRCGHTHHGCERMHTQVRVRKGCGKE